jgi:hypothetical protein
MDIKTVKTFIVLANLLLLGAVAQGQDTAPKHKVKVAVITFSENDKVQKVEVSEELKQALNSHTFKENAVDAEILSIDDHLDNEVVYIQ